MGDFEKGEKAVSDFKLKIQRFQQQEPNDATLNAIDQKGLSMKEMEVWEEYRRLILEMKRLLQEESFIAIKLQMPGLRNRIENFNRQINSTDKFYEWMRNRIGAPLTESNRIASTHTTKENAHIDTVLQQLTADIQKFT